MTIQELGIAMVGIPAGRFTMGSPESEVYRFKDEEQREVDVEGFEMSETVITQRQWRIVAGLPKVKIAIDPDPSQFKGDDLPVESVSWYEVKEFCARLSVATGIEYRLPTEEEWEYACRAGTTGPYAGDLDEMGWYEGNSEGQTHPVRQKKPNAFGLYDMHGNVFEWCEDEWTK